MKLWHWIGLAILTVLSLIAEPLLVHDHHAKHWWDKIPGFYILFGFIGCVAIVYLSKWYGKIFVFREEDYYQ